MHQDDYNTIVSAMHAIGEQLDQLEVYGLKFEIGYQAGEDYLHCRISEINPADNAVKQSISFNVYPNREIT